MNSENNFQKIWKDPVWSKVIAALLIGIGTVILSYIYSIISNISFQESFIAFWKTNIQLWVIALFIIIYIFIATIYKYVNLDKKKFKYDSDTLKLDISLFNKIRNELLPKNGTIEWLRHFNFAGNSFDREYLKEPSNFEYEGKQADFEFFNPELEKITKVLLFEIIRFNETMCLKTFTVGLKNQSIPSEWELTDSEGFWKLVKEIHENTHNICTKYDELVRVGRSILKV